MRPFDGLVTLTHHGFQSRSVQDGDFPPTVPDDPAPLERCRHCVDAASADAQHLREKLLCEHKLRSIHTVLCHQEPPRASLLNRMEPIARARDRHLDQ